MSKFSSNHPQESEDTAEFSSRPAHNRLTRPTLPEAIVGLVVLGVVTFGGGSQLSRLGLDPVVYGLVLTALSGVAGIAGFAAAVLLRIRSLSAFGVRPVSRRWLFIGAGAGLVAFVVKSLAVLAYIEITGNSVPYQTMYAEGGSGGVLSLILATLFISFLTPLGEELLFRGVITTVLLRHGRPVIAVVGSALTFAIAHGITVFPAALLVGLITAEIYRRSGSVWPAVVVHIVYNLPQLPLMVAAGIG